MSDCLPKQSVERASVQIDEQFLAKYIYLKVLLYWLERTGRGDSFHGKETELSMIALIAVIKWSTILNKNFLFDGIR